MEPPKRAFAKITHDCGRKMEIEFSDIDKPYTCPACGETETMSDENIQKIREGFGHALMHADRRRAATGEDARGVFNLRTGKLE